MLRPLLYGVRRMKSLLFCLVVATIAFSGCKFSKSEREKAEKEKARRATEASQSALEDQESRRFTIAQRDLEDRIRLFEGVSGSYEGRFTKAGGKSSEVRVKIATANLPAALNRVRPVRESDALSQMEALNLEIDIEETVEGASGKIVSCSASGIKPDFAKGTIRVPCAPERLSRIYVFGFDFNDDGFSMEDSMRSLTSRRRLVADNLVQAKVKTVDVMSFVITTPEMNFTDGKLWRQESAE